VVIAIVYAGVALLIGAFEAFEAFWEARDDPTWATRWESLDPAERSWLAVMATSRSWLGTLTDPEEIKLAKGCRRRERRYRLNYDLAAWPVLLVALALVLTGVIDATPILYSLLFLYAILRSLWNYRRDRQIKGALEAQRRVAASAA
jgi:hypothetical protein